MGRINNKSRVINRIPLPTKNTKTLRKKAGRAPKTTTPRKKDTAIIQLSSPKGAVLQSQSTKNQIFEFNSNGNKPEVLGLKRSERLKAKENKVTVSKYFSQPATLKKSSYILPRRIKSIYTNTDVKKIYPEEKLNDKKIKNEKFQLTPLISNSNTNNIIKFTRDALENAESIQINRSFEESLNKSTRIQWTIDIRSQFAKTLSKTLSTINKSLKGIIMTDNSNKDYARPDIMIEQKCSTIRNPKRKKKDNKVNCCENSFSNSQDTYESHHHSHNKENQQGKSSQAKKNNLEILPSTEDRETDSSKLLVPPSHWVYRTPERRPNQQLRLDDKTTMKNGLIQTQNGKMTVYAVNKRYENKYFVGDENNVPVSQEYFTHLGNFLKTPLKEIQELGVQCPVDQARFLNMRTSTNVCGSDVTFQFSELNESISPVNMGLAEANEDYDAFLISRPIKAMPTVSRRLLSEQFASTYLDDAKEEVDFISKKRLFSDMDMSAEEINLHDEVEEYTLSI